MDKRSLDRNVSRRSMLEALGVGAIATGVGASVATGRTASRRTRTLMAGTTQETTLYVNDSGEPGLTAFAIGGIHGDEQAGYLAAGDAQDWMPDTGTLVVLPRANTYAIRRGQREGPNGDLNRKFPLRAEPETELARQIWNVVTEFEPEFVVDLHESRGRYPGSPFLGQSVGFSPVRDLRNAAAVAMDDVNATIDGENDFEPRFLPSPAEYPEGVLVQKAAFERGIDTYIVETWGDLDLDDRVRWQKRLLRRLLDLRRAVHETSAPGHTLKVTGSGPVTRFEFDVSGEVFATDTLEGDSDSVGDSHVEGLVSTRGDYFQYTGRVESFTVTEGSAEDITLYVDGAEKNIDELTPTEPSTLDITGSGPKVEYQVSADEVFTDTSNLGDDDWVFEDRAYGFVKGGTDTYRYAQDIDHFAVTEGDPDDLTLAVDGEETTIDEVDESPTSELRIMGTGPAVRFQFAVTGTVEATDTLEGNDQVGEHTVEGYVSSGGDSYRFTGDVISFTVTEGSPDDIRILLDGVEKRVADLNPEDVHELRVEGTGPETQFVADASELTYPTATLEGADRVGVSRIVGHVSTQTDRYLFDGEITAFTVTEGSAEDITLYVDDQETSVAALNGGEKHAIEVHGSGPATRFTFTADETVQATETLEEGDDVSERSVSGLVTSGADRYLFDRDIVSFTVTEGSAEDVTVYVDGSETSVEALNPEWVHDLRVVGTGPETQFTVTVSGTAYPTGTLEGGDSVGDTRIDGRVSVQDDRYLFEGDVTEFDVTEGNAGDIEVYVDGERTTPENLDG